MKVKLLPALFLFAGQFSFSQTEKPVKGKVLCDNFLLAKVNVINKTNKTGTVTNENGEFIIEAKANDSLVFYAKEYHLLKLKLTSAQVDQNNLLVIMVKKPEELEEIVINKVTTFEWKTEEEKKKGIILGRPRK